jgi:hypothetical protein
MKLKLFACLMLGTLATVSQAVAAPIFTPFLSVDVNGYNADGGQSKGPNAAGYQDFTAAQDLFADPSINWGSSGAAGLTNVYGAYTVNIKGIPGAAGNRAARNRGANAGALSDVTQDFVYAERGNNGGFGQHWIKVTVSGLIPNQGYEMTAFAREPFNGGVGATDASFQAWSDRNRLGGLDGPGLWMDANVGPGALYGPVYGSPADPVNDGNYKNPIPTAVRSPVSGPDSADPYAYAATFLTKANGSGVIEVYGWGDPQSFSGTQTVSLLNGFQLGQVPEPTSLVLFGLGMMGLTVYRRRS